MTKFRVRELQLVFTSQCKFTLFNILEDLNLRASK